MKILLLLLLIVSQTAFAQEEKATTVADIQKVVQDTLSSKWYEKIQLRGYSHFRYNRLFETNSKLKCASCDRSIGDKQGFFLRRARLTFFGEVSDRVFIYIQPDYSTDAVTQQSYFQIRDAYFDYALNESKEWRIRTGISKVPYGFDNLQSSSNRGPLDRDDALNSGAPNERDIGLFLMYAPTEIRKRFKDLTSNNLKGTGDYGLFSFGAYNGQSLNRAEKNNDLHRVVRMTYPFKLKNGQFIEASLQAYEGQFNTYNDVAALDKDVYDQRTAASFIVYPQPFGFQAEYNVGQGPEYDKQTNSIQSQKLKGGYVQVNYQYYVQDQRFFPYVRYQEYDGGKKLEAGSPSNQVREWEFGTEWQPNTALELTIAYAKSDRTTQSSPTNLSHQVGQLLRMQAQFNY